MTKRTQISSEDKARILKEYNAFLDTKKSLFELVALEELAPPWEDPNWNQYDCAEPCKTAVRVEHRQYLRLLEEEAKKDLARFPKLCCSSASATMSRNAAIVARESFEKDAMDWYQSQVGSGTSPAHAQPGACSNGLSHR